MVVTISRTPKEYPFHKILLCICVRYQWQSIDKYAEPLEPEIDAKNLILSLQNQLAKFAFRKSIFCVEQVKWQT